MRTSKENAHTRHLKQSRWNVPSRARTNWPVSGSPHFLHIRVWPLAVRPFLCRDRFLSPLRRGGCSSVHPAGGGAEVLGAEPVGLRRYRLSGVLRPPFCQFLSTG